MFYESKAFGHGSKGINCWLDKKKGVKYSLVLKELDRFWYDSQSRFFPLTPHFLIQQRINHHFMPLSVAFTEF